MPTPGLSTLQRALHRLDVPPGGAGWNLPELEGLLPGDAGQTEAAVLVGLLPRGAELQVLLTRRTEMLRHHAGQVSFPGGRVETTDGGPLAAALREAHERKNEGGGRLTLAEARANRLAIDWARFEPVRPRRTGPIVFEDYDLRELVARIDWKPFFQAWELAGAYPAILDDPVVGTAARALHEDALAMLDRMIAETWTRPRAVVSFFPANAEGDDIVLFADEARTRRLAVAHTLRQQRKPSPGRPNLALADYVAPLGSGRQDWLGAFVVTAGAGIEEKALAFERANDDYASILAKALGDRLAEAFAERMHERVRKEFWGYAPEERFTNVDLIGEHYRGIRPAPGYPACPDHTEKRTLFRLLDAERAAGVSLTESCAMLPASSVSGWYFAHPDAAYFGVARIERDQAEDYARRKGVPLEEVERWLAPNLGYAPLKRAAGG